MLDPDGKPVAALSEAEAGCPAAAQGSVKLTAGLFEAAGISVGNCQPIAATIPTTAGIIERGQAALARLERNAWPDWRAVIEAVGEGDRLSLLEAKANTRKSRHYSERMASWLRLYGFDRFDRADRCRLLECSDNLTALETWRSGLSAEQQLAFNHPRVVLSHWKRSRRKPTTERSEFQPSPPIFVESISEEMILAWWASASTEAKHRIHEHVLTDIGEDEFRRNVLPALPRVLLDQLEDYVLGQRMRSAKNGRGLPTTLTRLLYLALREPDGAAEHLGRMHEKLKSNNRRLEDVVVNLFTRRGR